MSFRDVGKLHLHRENNIILPCRARPDGAQNEQDKKSAAKRSEADPEALGNLNAVLAASTGNVYEFNCIAERLLGN